MLTRKNFRNLIVWGEGIVWGGFIFSKKNSMGGQKIVWRGFEKQKRSIDLLSSKDKTKVIYRLAAYGHLPANFVTNFSTNDLES